MARLDSPQQPRQRDLATSSFGYACSDAQRGIAESSSRLLTVWDTAISTRTDGTRYGRSNFGYSLDNGVDPTFLFPRLPDNAAAAAKGWEGLYAGDEAQTRYSSEEKKFSSGRDSRLYRSRRNPARHGFAPFRPDDIHIFNLERGLVVKGTGTSF